MHGIDAMSQLPILETTTEPQSVSDPDSYPSPSSTRSRFRDRITHSCRLTASIRARESSRDRSLGPCPGPPLVVEPLASLLAGHVEQHHTHWMYRRAGTHRDAQTKERIKQEAQQLLQER